MRFKISVYDSTNAPGWVKAWNAINLFLTGFAFGEFFGAGFESMFINWFTLYICIYALTIGRFFIPKKRVEFPNEFFWHLIEQWSAAFSQKSVE